MVKTVVDDAFKRVFWGSWHCFIITNGPLFSVFKLFPFISFSPFQCSLTLSVLELEI